ncbi:hypothetical protein IGI96_003714 [Enterococcus sp. DIV0421]|uniref:hypothetical protein n=1 Tax=Enterococcus sp. DIV0421 TaxID=2774688 RepID=UPI003F2066C7
MKNIENYILNLGYRCVLFRRMDAFGKIVGDNYLITESGLLGVKLCHEGTRAIYVQTGRKTSLKKIEKKIRLVFDHNGVLIARRASPVSPLRLTGKGMGKLVEKNPC